MKKSLVFILVMLCGIFNADATVFVSGIISTNTTWTKANSPYIVNGDLSVDSNVTLTIEPGVEVRIDSTRAFLVDGKLIAEGTATDTIKFTANGTIMRKPSWIGITFRIKACRDTSRIKYCRFEYGSTAIDNTGTNLLIYNSVFIYSNIALYLRPTPYLGYNYYIKINKCLITENSKGLYHLNISPSPGEFTENTVTYNSIGYQDESTSSGLIINNNVFNYNSTGMHLSNGPKRGPAYNTFKGNSYCGLNILNGSESTPISNNTFIYNTGGILISNINSGSITNNTMAYNDVAISHNYYSSSTISISNNCFYNNFTYNYSLQSQFDYNIKNNWWGSTSTGFIDSSIYDYYDAVARGKVTYTPILTSSSGCATVAPPPPCLQPSSITATATSTTTATVTWPAVTGAPAYEYYVVPISSFPPTSGTISYTNSLSLASLTPGATYNICVRTKCASAPFLSSWVCDTLTMPFPHCDSPAAIHINLVTANNAVISWDTATASTGYEYYVATHPSTPPSTSTFTKNNITFISGLNPKTTYDFCVRSKCGATTFSAWTCDTLRTPNSINTISIDNAVRIYPNPSNGTFNVTINDGGYINATIIVYDITGRMITTKPMSMGTETISLGNVAKGIYTVKVLTDNAVHTQRISIE